MSMILYVALMQVALLSGGPVAAEKPQATPPKTEAVAATDTAKNGDAEADESYTEAHRVTEKTGKPLLVMVGADWCSPCQNMRKTILPRVRDHGLFRKIAFAHVNVDNERELAQQITGGGAVPQLVMYRKTKDGWKRRIMIGYHSVEEVEKFINEDLAIDDDHRDEAQAAKESSASKSTTSTEQADDEKQHG
jgi:thioredoxin-like negative regulator of GroEL